MTASSSLDPPSHFSLSTKQSPSPSSCALHLIFPSNTTLKARFNSTLEIQDRHHSELQKQDRPCRPFQHAPSATQNADTQALGHSFGSGVSTNHVSRRHQSFKVKTLKMALHRRFLSGFFWLCSNDFPPFRSVVFPVIFDILIEQSGTFFCIRRSWRSFFFFFLKGWRKEFIYCKSIALQFSRVARSL
jgi:hypothetical protein